MSAHDHIILTWYVEAPVVRSYKVATPSMWYEACANHARAHGKIHSSHLRQLHMAGLLQIDKRTHYGMERRRRWFVSLYTYFACLPWLPRPARPALPRSTGAEIPCLLMRSEPTIRQFQPDGRFRNYWFNHSSVITWANQIGWNLSRYQHFRILNQHCCIWISSLR